MDIDDLKAKIADLQDIVDDLDDFAREIDDCMDIASEPEPEEVDGNVVDYQFQEEVSNLIFQLRIEAGSREHMTDYQKGQWDALMTIKRLWNESLMKGYSIENAMLQY